MDEGFFLRDAEQVAKALLGKILVRKINGKEKKARIVETEAYYDENDPASRACQNGDLRETMKMSAGTILIYGVHNSWLMNFVTGCEGKAEAVLLRALEPLNFDEKCSGPGLLTKALLIDKSFHKQNIIDNSELMIIDNKQNIIDNSELMIIDNKEIGDVEESSEGDKDNKDEDNFGIVKSFRIGVKKDLPKKLRFYIKNSPFVSKK